jgi:hypothetical protein
MNKPATLADLWSVEDAVWSVEDRMMATELTLNVLLVTLHESGAIDPARLQRHLAAATNRFEEQTCRELPGVVAALDALRQHLDVLLPPRPSAEGN